jgi:hypothetical protein
LLVDQGLANHVQLHYRTLLGLLAAAAECHGYGRQSRATCWPGEDRIKPLIAKKNWSKTPDSAQMKRSCPPAYSEASESVDPIMISDIVALAVERMQCCVQCFLIAPALLLDCPYPLFSFINREP